MTEPAEKTNTDGWKNYSEGGIAGIENSEWVEINGLRYCRANQTPTLPGLPMAELGAKPGDTILCVWVDEDFEDEYPVGFQAIVNGDGRFLGLTGEDWSGSDGRWEIVKRADKPKGLKRARIAELEAQLAELNLQGNYMAAALSSEGYTFMPHQWKTTVERFS